MAFKIYTKTGDDGQTSLYGGARLPKSDIRIEAYGTVDELNSAIGHLLGLVHDTHELPELVNVQHRLFVIGSVLASDPNKEMQTPPLQEAAVSELEVAIDRMQKVLPALKQFVLPGGPPQASWTHMCRTICRRAERRVVALHHDSAVPTGVITYLNRLSDYLFVLARWLLHKNGSQETPWDQSI